MNEQEIIAARIQEAVRKSIEEGDVLALLRRRDEIVEDMLRLALQRSPGESWGVADAPEGFRVGQQVTAVIEPPKEQP